MSVAISRALPCAVAVIGAAAAQPAFGLAVQDEGPRKGFEVSTADGRYSAHLWFRGQFRLTYPFADPPRDAAAFGRPASAGFEIRRARIKLEGNAYRPWLEYYVEQDLPSSRLLDFRFTVTKLPALQLRIGQWKANYNRERVDSSGRQQFVERSIVNREFTLDRQQGMMVFGRLWPGRRTDSRYWFGVFNGNGRGEGNDDSSLMWMGRYQWNFLGRDLAFLQSDIERHQEPTGSLAIGTVRNRSAFTRFSSSGPGNLDGFEEGLPDQYTVRQWVEEVAFKYRGFSLQHELHWKRIQDSVQGDLTRLRGGYVQVGYMLRPWSGLPGDTEIAVRHAWVDPDTEVSGDRRREWTVALNWFLAGHDNKITLDASLLTLERASGGHHSDPRARAQWDISF